MNLQELDEIYVELKEIEAILYMLSNVNSDALMGEYIPIIACHYQELLQNIMNKIEKHL